MSLVVANGNEFLDFDVWIVESGEVDQAAHQRQKIVRGRVVRIHYHYRTLLQSNFHWKISTVSKLCHYLVTIKDIRVGLNFQSIFYKSNEDEP